MNSLLRAPQQMCAHCGLAVPLRRLAAEEGCETHFCCQGCQVVYQLISEAGLGKYYEHRERPSGKPVDEIDRQVPSYSAEMLRSFQVDGSYHFILDGLHCAACVWLIEHVVGRIGEVQRVEINYALSRMRVVLSPDSQACPQILESVAQLGYSAIPYDPRSQERPRLQGNRQLLLRLGVAGCAAGNIMLMAFALYAGAQDELLFRQVFHWLSLLLCLPVILFSAQPYWKGAWQALRQGRLTSDVPITLGLAVTFGYSVWATLLDLEHAYFDTAATFVFVLLIGRTLEGSARARAGSVVERLMALTPHTTRRWLRSEDRAEEIEVDQLAVGEWVEVLPGQKVAVDGIVRLGNSFVDTSALSGESLPQAVHPGDRVVAGSLSLDGRLLIEVEKSSESSLLYQVRRFLEQAESSGCKTQRRVDSIARIFLSVTLVAAALCYLYWMRRAPDSAWYYAVTVLIITCPCALGISTPLVVSTACGLGASRGILFRGGEALERVPHLTHLLLDKTGTLTTGKMEVIGCSTLRGTREELLAWAASAEASCTHPIAKALLRAHEGALYPIRELQQQPGLGLVATLDGARGPATVRVGSPGFVGATASEGPILATGGSAEFITTRIAVEVDGTLLGFIELADQLRPDAQFIVTQLQKRYKLAIASGDQSECVRLVAQQLGIKEFQGRCSPLDKARWVQRLQAEGGVVGVLGDGINDAPALKAADLGIVVDQASDLSTAAADIVLLRPGLSPLMEALDIGQKSMARLTFNFALAALYNLIAIPSAALGYVSPLWAAVAMPLSSLSVTWSSVSLYWNQSKVKGS